MQREVAAFLAKMGKYVAAVARDKAGKLAKDKEGGPVTGAVEGYDYGPLRRKVEKRIAAIAKDGGNAALHQVGADINELLEVVNENAVAWAATRVGELITEIEETTRETVQGLVDRALEDGLSNDELADLLAEHAGFGDARAEMIARTETAFADVQGNLIGWKESGVVGQKEWSVSQDEVCEDCVAMDGLVVELDDEFPEGDPPLHPNCRCLCLPIIRDPEEAEG